MSLEYDIIRSNRQTLVIQITRSGQIIVRCNYNTKTSDIKNFICEKEKWIFRHLSQLNNNKINIGIGCSVLFLGKRYRIVAGDNEGIIFDDTAFYVKEQTREEELRELLKGFYKERAKKVITDRVHTYEQIMKLHAEKIGITSASTRWGSCSGHARLNFSWKVVMGNLEIVDYVVVHELAHIKEKNHSCRFWSIVERYMPDYKKARSELKRLGLTLYDEGWG